jgi:Tol biopolymer transport system component
MNLDGSNQMQLTNGIGEKHATISPDGKWVFYNSVDKYTLWKVSIEGGEPVKLTDEYAGYPSVSHDGEMIAYYKKKNDSKSIINISYLSDMKKIKTFDLAFGKLASLKLDWDSKNQSVIYAVEKDGVINLLRQGLNGEPPQTIATFKAESVFYFAWSPDYKQFAFLRGKWRKDAIMISD